MMWSAHLRSIYGNGHSHALTIQPQRCISSTSVSYAGRWSNQKSDRVKNWKKYISKRAKKRNKRKIERWKAQNPLVKPSPAPVPQLSAQEEKITQIEHASAAELFTYKQKPIPSPQQVLAQQDADALWAGLKQGNFECTRSHYNHLLRVLGAQGRLDDVMEVYQSMFDLNLEPDVYTYTSVITACGNQRNAEAAITVLDTMEEVGLLPTDVTYGAVIQACVRANEIDRGFSMLQRAAQQGIELTAELFTHLIVACVRMGDMKRAWSTFDHMRTYHAQPDAVAYTAMISACGRTDFVERALTLYEEMLQFGVQPTHVTFNAIIYACARSFRRYKHAFDLAEEMKANGYAHDLRTYNALLLACSHAGLVNKAKEYMYQLHADSLQPDLVTFNSMLAVYARAMNQVGPKALRNRLRKMSPEEKREYELQERIEGRDLLKIDEPPAPGTVEIPAEELKVKGDLKELSIRLLAEYYGSRDKDNQGLNENVTKEELEILDQGANHPVFDPPSSDVGEGDLADFKDPRYIEARREWLEAGLSEGALRDMEWEYIHGRPDTDTEASDEEVRDLIARRIKRGQALAAKEAAFRKMMGLPPTKFELEERAEARELQATASEAGYNLPGLNPELLSDGDDDLISTPKLASQQSLLSVHTKQSDSLGSLAGDIPRPDASAASLEEVEIYFNALRAHKRQQLASELKSRVRGARQAMGRRNTRSEIQDTRIKDEVDAMEKEEHYRQDRTFAAMANMIANPLLRVDLADLASKTDLPVEQLQTLQKCLQRGMPPALALAEAGVDAEYGLAKLSADIGSDLRQAYDTETDTDAAMSKIMVNGVPATDYIYKTDEDLDYKPDFMEDDVSSMVDRIDERLEEDFARKMEMVAEELEFQVERAQEDSKIDEKLQLERLGMRDIEAEIAKRGPMDDNELDRVMQHEMKSIFQHDAPTARSLYNQSLVENIPETPQEVERLGRYFDVMAELSDDNTSHPALQISSSLYSQAQQITSGTEQQARKPREIAQKKEKEMLDTTRKPRKISQIRDEEMLEFSRIEGETSRKGENDTVDISIDPQNYLSHHEFPTVPKDTTRIPPLQQDANNFVHQQSKHEKELEKERNPIPTSISQVIKASTEFSPEPSQTSHVDTIDSHNSLFDTTDISYQKNSISAIDEPNNTIVEHIGKGSNVSTDTQDSIDESGYLAAGSESEEEFDVATMEHTAFMALRELTSKAPYPGYDPAQVVDRKGVVWEPVARYDDMAPAGMVRRRRSGWAIQGYDYLPRPKNLIRRHSDRVSDIMKIAPNTMNTFLQDNSEQLQATAATFEQWIDHRRQLLSNVHTKHSLLDEVHDDFEKDIAKYERIESNSTDILTRLGASIEQQQMTRALWMRALNEAKVPLNKEQVIPYSPSDFITTTLNESVDTPIDLHTSETKIGADTPHGRFYDPTHTPAPLPYVTQHTYPHADTRNNHTTPVEEHDTNVSNNSNLSRITDYMGDDTVAIDIAMSARAAGMFTDQSAHNVSNTDQSEENKGLELSSNHTAGPMDEMYTLNNSKENAVKADIVPSSTQNLKDTSATQDDSMDEFEAEMISLGEKIAADWETSGAFDALATPLTSKPIESQADLHAQRRSPTKYEGDLSSSTMTPQTTLHSQTVVEENEYNFDDLPEPEVTRKARQEGERQLAHMNRFKDRLTQAEKDHSQPLGPVEQALIRATDSASQAEHRGHAETGPQMFDALLAVKKLEEDWLDKDTLFERSNVSAQSALPSFDEKEAGRDGFDWHKAEGTVGIMTPHGEEILQARTNLANAVQPESTGEKRLRALQQFSHQLFAGAHWAPSQIPEDVNEARQQFLTEALNTYSEIKRNGIKPDRITLNTVVNALTSSGRAKQAYVFIREEFVNQGIMPDERTFRSLIRMHQKARRMDLCEDLVEKMRTYDIAMSPDCYGLLVHGYARDYRIDDAIDLLGEMKEKGLVCPEKHAFLLRQRCKELSIWHELVPEHPDAWQWSPKAMQLRASRGKYVNKMSKLVMHKMNGRNVR